MSKVKIVVFLTLLAAATASPCAASTWYVDAKAAGPHDGRSKATAWTSFATINQSSLGAGDIIFVYQGIYDERFVLTKGGLPGRRITYKGINYPVLRGVDGGSCGHICLLSFELFQGSTAYNYPGIRLAGATDWLVQDNVIHGINGANGGFVEAYNTVNNNNIIRANTFQDIGIVPGCKTLGISVMIRGNHNLIEYNSFGRGDDKTNIFGKYNIVRNNYMGPMLEKDIPAVDPHIDDMQSYNSKGLLFDTNLFERNFSNQNDTDNAHCFFIRNTIGEKIRHLIARFNVSSRNGSFVSQLENVDAVWIYNNTFVDIQDRVPVERKDNYAVSLNGLFGGHSSWKNNTFTRASRNIGGEILFIAQAASADQDYNHTFLSGAARGTHSITGKDPRFSDERNLDFTLTERSPLHGAGGPLTYTKNSGNSSTMLAVEDAGGLCDGWGIVDGDFISIGRVGYVQIRSVDYELNLIELVTPQKWAVHSAVYLKRCG